MTRSNRNYPPKTIKILFALSGNKCAHPRCEETLVKHRTEKSDSIVIANICHIYSINEDGPRGNGGFTEEELNAPENLILLCPTHHAVVDKQPETYTVDELKEWKQTHESKMREEISSNSQDVHSTIISYPPLTIVDHKIEEEINTLRKSRFFSDFDRIKLAPALGKRLVEGDLSGGTEAVKSRALAWCSRLLSTEEIDKAEKFLNLAKSLGTCPEVNIADAFILSQKGDKRAALKILADIDSQASRSASLMVVTHHKDAKGAFDWLESAGIGMAELDSDGKFFFLHNQLKLSRWEAARETLDAISDRDFNETPALHYMTGMTYLLSAVPLDLRTVVFDQLPRFNAVDFQLGSNAEKMIARRTAQSHFAYAAAAAQKLNCFSFATLADEYALWLELKDPENFDKGKQRLEDRLRNLKSALRLVPLGFQFRINLDLAAIEQEIERQIALNGGITLDAAIARLALSTQKAPEEGANYLARNYDELSKYLDKKVLRVLQIEMLLRARQPKQANECLESLLGEKDLSEIEEKDIRRMIAAAEGSDPVEDLKTQFQKDNSLKNLMLLVYELERREKWGDLCKYGEILFNKTSDIHDAERLATALNKAQKTEQLVIFLETNRDILLQSSALQMSYAWALYYEGALLEAKSELEKLNEDRENRNYRTLKVGLAITLGDWNSLSEFVTNEYQTRNKRSAGELIFAAQLALHSGLPHAKDLLFAAADKGNDDANILAEAYFLASNAGWENDPEVCLWLQKAAELSGDDGPIRKMTLQNMLDQKPAWDHQVSEICQLLNRGKIPMYLAAQTLNKSLIELMLVPALENQSERDPRRRNLIPAYSGKRQPKPFVAGGTVGMDATTLLTLSYLNILDETFNAFKLIYVPHSTLAWLFSEKQKAAFHQPSLIRNAHKVRDLLATGILEKFVPSTVADGNLSDQIGNDLALLIAEAEKARDDNDIQRIVVRPFPVYRAGSLMNEEADLTGHAVVISSCLSIVNTLRQKDQITTEEEKKACAYLQLREKPWPNQPEITDGAILYLDSLATTFFLHLEMLDKLKPAGFRVIAAPSVVSEADALIAYENISSEVNNAIEHIRSAVNLRIESGKIKVGRRCGTNESHEQSQSAHPTIEVLDLARSCDAVIIDDRCLNQHEHVAENGVQVPIFSTLDFLDSLVSSNTITAEKRLEYRTKLRRAGYFFVPINADELAHHLNNSTVENGEVIETAELKSIRENILHIRMSNWLQIPEEVPWLNTTLKVFIQVLQNLWRADADLSNVEALSGWIVNQLDIRGWAHAYGSQDGDNIAKSGPGTHILMLFAPPADIPQDIKNAYWSWVDKKISTPIKEQYPDLYAEIIERHKKRISKIADTKLTKEKQHEK